jgi:hypothetical protein
MQFHTLLFSLSRTVSSHNTCTLVHVYFTALHRLRRHVLKPTTQAHSYTMRNTKLHHQVTVALSPLTVEIPITTQTKQREHVRHHSLDTTTTPQQIPLQSKNVKKDFGTAKSSKLQRTKCIMTVETIHGLCKTEKNCD